MYKRKRKRKREKKGARHLSIRSSEFSGKSPAQYERNRGCDATYPIDRASGRSKQRCVCVSGFSKPERRDGAIYAPENNRHGVNPLFRLIDRLPAKHEQRRTVRFFAAAAGRRYRLGRVFRDGGGVVAVQHGLPGIYEGEYQIHYPQRDELRQDDEEVVDSLTNQHVHMRTYTHTDMYMLHNVR